MARKLEAHDFDCAPPAPDTDFKLLNRGGEEDFRITVAQCRFRW